VCVYTPLLHIHACGSTATTADSSCLDAEVLALGLHSEVPYKQASCTDKEFTCIDASSQRMLHATICAGTAFRTAAALISIVLLACCPD
jgi:hypothetical protein